MPRELNGAYLPEPLRLECFAKRNNRGRAVETRDKSKGRAENSHRRSTNQAHYALNSRFYRWRLHGDYSAGARFACSRAGDHARDLQNANRLDRSAKGLARRSRLPDAPTGGRSFGTKKRTATRPAFFTSAMSGGGLLRQQNVIYSTARNGADEIDLTVRGQRSNCFCDERSSKH